MKTTLPKCPKCQGARFELRVLKDEAVASARCLKCTADYLLLDSKDYWFDVIQQGGYPRITRCSCNNQSFHLRIDYNFRDDGDVDYIEVHSICAACGKTKRQLDLKIDYCGTQNLFKRPLVACKNPKILYDLKHLSLLVELQDMANIADYLALETKCKFACWLRSQNNWNKTELGVEGIKGVIERDKYLYIYAMPMRISIAEYQVNTLKKENAFWKRSEVIRIGPKTHVCTYKSARSPSNICYCSDPPTHSRYTEVGLSFYIDFSNEFVRGEKIISKSECFRNTTAGLLSMLKDEFVCWRGRHCFDNPDVNVRIFGDRFRKKVKSM
jgi:hypothetical protein